MMTIKKADIVSDGMMVTFSTGEVFYLSAQSLYENLERLECCSFVEKSPSHAGSDLVSDPHLLVKMLVGRDEMLTH